jgi:hypothetical protein
MPDLKMAPEDAKRDLHAAKVLDLETGEEQASYLNQGDPVDFALDLIELGKYYNNAIVAVERGTAAEAATGGTVILKLSEMAYPGQYKHKEWWKRGGEKKIIEQEGLPTNRRTRPVVLNKLKNFFEENPDLFWDINLLKQMQVFILNEKGIPAAATGSHDDAVLASAIAHFVRLVLLNYVDPLSFRSERYNQSAED